MAKYDIVVVGGGTAGCAAAYTAGKSGFKTLLVEKNAHLGGSITSGLVVPAMKAGKNQINTDFFNILCEELHKIGGQITYQDNKGWFNPELTKIVLDKLMKDAGVDVVFGAKAESVKITCHSEQSEELLSYERFQVETLQCIPPHPNPLPLGEGVCSITSLKLLSVYNYSIQNTQEILSEPIEARYVIDATGNCEIGKICGCEFLDDTSLKTNKKPPSPQPSPSGGEGVMSQPFSLRFMMGNIDLKCFSDWLLEFDQDRNVSTVEHIAPHPNPLPKGTREYSVHLSTAYTWDEGKNWALKPLFDDAVEKGILKDADRNYFQIFTVAGMLNTVAFNCPRILDTQDYTKALQQGRESILRISEFCRIYLPGFENAFISNIADELGVRVSNRIRGKYIYTIDDLRSGKKFENPVVISDYPVDVHSDKKDSSTLEVVQDYQLPVESLMSADIENLFVVGRCLSADFLSQGALRVQPNCFAMGEGVVKWIKRRVED